MSSTYLVFLSGTPRRLLVAADLEGLCGRADGRFGGEFSVGGGEGGGERRCRRGGGAVGAEAAAGPAAQGSKRHPPYIVTSSVLTSLFARLKLLGGESKHTLRKKYLRDV